MSGAKCDVNQGLAGIERIAVSVAKNASEGIDGMTASMVKGSLAGNLLPPLHVRRGGRVAGTPVLPALHAKNAWRGPRCWPERSGARPSG